MLYNFNICQVSRLLKFPCRYHPMGCKEAHSLSAKAEHERNCPYLQLKCPFHGQCSFGGALSAVVPHLKSEHAVTPVPGRLSSPQKYHLWIWIQLTLCLQCNPPEPYSTVQSTSSRETCGTSSLSGTRTCSGSWWSTSTPPPSAGLRTATCWSLTYSILVSR